MELKHYKKPKRHCHKENTYVSYSPKTLKFIIVTQSFPVFLITFNSTEINVESR